MQDLVEKAPSALLQRNKSSQIKPIAVERATLRAAQYTYVVSPSSISAPQETSMIMNSLLPHTYFDYRILLAVVSLTRVGITVSRMRVKM